MDGLETLFISETNSNWVDALPSYQKDTINDLLTTKSLEETASIWLESTVNNNSPFGAEKKESEKKYFAILKSEVNKLVCGDPEYQNERNELNGLINQKENKAAIISLVSAFIGAKVGLAATFIAPAIVIIFTMIGKVSLTAWCKLKVDSQDLNS
jgi:hypothetical protein